MSSGNAGAPCGTTLLACFGVSRAGGQSGYAEGYGAEAEKRIPSSGINSHSILLWDTRELANSRIPRDNSVSVSSRGRSNAEGAGDQRNVAIEPIRNADWNCDMHSNYPQPAETPRLRVSLSSQTRISHDLCGHRELHSLQIHGLRRSLPS